MAPAALAAFAFVLTQVPDLPALQWKNRVLLLFAPSSADPRLTEQLSRLRNELPALSERDLLVYQLTGEAAGIAELRHRMGVNSSEFAVILVGKDGGRKARYSEPVDPAKIYSKIDAMPMRRDEMRRSGVSQPAAK